MLETFKSHIVGFCLSVFIAGAALLLAAQFGAPASLLALFIGMVLSFTYQHNAFKTGIDCASNFILRVGVALLGFRIVFDDVLALGWQTAFMIVLGITLTIIFGIFLARMLGLSKEFGALTGGAVSICGASAAVAISAVLPDHKNKDRDLSLTIIGITAFSTLAMVVYPLIGAAFGFNTLDMAVFLGGSIHDVAQTAGAGYSVSTEVGDIAILTKMTRVAFLLPVVVGLMMLFKTSREAEYGALPVPKFLIMFVIFMVINSLAPIPQIFTDHIGTVARFALITAIAAVGLKTNIVDVLAVGPKPIILIAAQTLCMMGIILACVIYL